jgi:hypothetical protein
MAAEPFPTAATAISAQSFLLMTGAAALIIGAATAISAQSTGAPIPIKATADDH